jgi:hypothetical protein
MIGETLYIYDQNRVVRGPDRVIDFARSHWRAYKVEGETRTSWLLQDGVKVEKETLQIRGKVSPGWSPRAYTEQQKSERVWLQTHQRHILRLVERADCATLRQIAALVGYEEGE